MKHLLILLTAATMLITACSQPQPAPAEQAPEKKEDTTATHASYTPPDSATMMQAWAAYATPGEIHAQLAKADGEWTGDITMWWEPGAPPVKNTGTAVNTMVLGGRYQLSKHTGNFNGMPFEGMSLLGYDNAKKKYISTWMDNMGTGILIMEGTMDEATKTIHFTGKQVDPVSGTDFDVRETYQIIDDNTHYMEMFMKYPGAEEFKTMELRSTRKTS